MTDLGVGELAYCAAALVLAFAVRGGAGFGGGAVATPLLVLVLPPHVVVPAVAVLNMLSSLGHGARNWHKCAWREVVRVAPFTLAGVGIGLYLLFVLDPKPLSRALGVFVVLYAAYALCTAGRAPRVPARWLNPLAGSVSLAAGCVGTAFGGAAGPIYVVYLSQLSLGRDVFRVTITTIMLCLSIYRIAGYAGFGFLDRESLTLLAMALPPMLVGAWLGERVVRRFDPVRFSRAVGVVILASGVALIVK